MYKTYIIFFVALIAFSGFCAPSALAADFYAGEKYVLPQEQAVQGDLYTAGEEVRLVGSVAGDANVVGMDVASESAVTGDFHAIGATVALTGSVSGDARILGSDITIAGTVGEDMVIAGESVKIQKGAVIKGDLYIFSSYVEIEGTVLGTTTIRARMVSIGGALTGPLSVKAEESLALSDTARLGGNLSYRAPTELVRSEGAIVSGTTTYESSPLASGASLSVVIAMQALVMFLFFFFSSIIYVALFRNYAERTVERALRANGRTILTGLLAFIAVPIVSVLLCVTFVGIPLGLLLLVLYLLFIGSALLLSGALAGALITLWHKKTPDISVRWTGVGVFALRVASLVPIFGWLVNVCAFGAMFGALWEDLYFFGVRRKKETASESVSNSERGETAQTESESAETIPEDDTTSAQSEDNGKENA